MTTTDRIELELTRHEAHLVRRALVKMGADPATTDADRDDVVNLVDYIESEEGAS